MQEDLNDGGYEYWPVTRADLDPHYDRVEQMIGLQHFPFDHEPYASTPKTIAFKEAAEALGLRAGSCPSSRSRSPTRAARRCPARRSSRSIPNLHGRTPHDLPAVRRVRRRLQLRRQEHARLQLPHARQAPRAPRSARSADVRRFEPREGGGYTRPLRRPRGRQRPRRRRRSTLTCDHLILSRGHARHDQPAAAQPRRAARALAASSARASAATATCSR